MNKADKENRLRATMDQYIALRPDSKSILVSKAERKTFAGLDWENSGKYRGREVQFG